MSSGASRQWANGDAMGKKYSVQPLQERKLLAYPVVKVLEQTQQVALERDGRLIDATW